MSNGDVLSSSSNLYHTTSLRKDNDLLDDIVISGFSGRYPECNSVDEFGEALFAHKDLITEDDRRWPVGYHGLPRRHGKLKDIQYFDASFFNVHPKQADNMDPQLRLLLEVVYETIVDAGIDPEKLKGSRTGVYVGASTSDAAQAFAKDPEKLSKYGMTGCAHCMFANRVSFFFDFNGPSYMIDTACSSSMMAVDQAMMALRTGICDSAIVAGVSLTFKAQSSIQFNGLNMLSEYGACRAYDESGVGYVRSETISAMLLQKKRDSIRYYATIIHSKSNADGAKENGITFPSGSMQQKLLKEVYEESEIPPENIEYVETHGTGTKAGDPQELGAIANIFCNEKRNGGLLIGSTKSNMGHPEPASGVAALSKVLIAIQRKELPANLHYQNPNKDIPSLLNGKLVPIVENKKWEGGLCALNSFGFGGANAHVLMKGNYNNEEIWNSNELGIRLIGFASRTSDNCKEALTRIIKNVKDEKFKKYQRQLEYLICETCQQSLSLQPFRSFALMKNDDVVYRSVSKAKNLKRPIWFVFSGMGTQYSGMGKSMLKIKVFADTISRCATALNIVDIDLYELINNSNEKTFDDIIHSFVTIAAIQVALTDTLCALGIRPDGIIGHSVGELGCAYSDNCFTPEETVLCAYWRGRCIKDANLPEGGMAAVGMTWEECKIQCPNGVVPACHNAAQTVTISGPKKMISEYVEELKKKNVFAKEVLSSGIAFHSYYMTDIAPKLREATENIVKSPYKKRSEKWISTSINSDKWKSELASSASPAYMANNLCSPVLFQEGLKFIPENALVIEIAPHSLLQAVLKRSLDKSVVCFGLMRRDKEDNELYFYEQIGNIYSQGININFNVLQKTQVQLPLDARTPNIASLVGWEHMREWKVPHYTDFLTGISNDEDNSFNKKLSFNYNINLEEDKWKFVSGHRIDGRILFPATGYLCLVWDAVSRYNGYESTDKCPIQFDEISILRATVLTDSSITSTVVDDVILTVNLLVGENRFEILENGNVVVKGEVKVGEEPILQMRDVINNWKKEVNEKNLPLSMSDIYKELNLRGYEYSGLFNGIHSIDSNEKHGKLIWNDNWISFLDTMLQLQVMSMSTSFGLYLPTRIRSVRIDPIIHHQLLEKMMDVVYLSEINLCAAGGIEISGLHATYAPKRTLKQIQPIQPEIEGMIHLPFFEHCKCEIIDKEILSANKVDGFNLNENASNQFNLLKEMELNEEKFIRQFPSDKLNDEISVFHPTNNLIFNLLNKYLTHIMELIVDRLVSDQKSLKLNLMEYVDGMTTDRGDILKNIFHLLTNEKVDLSDKSNYLKLFLFSIISWLEKENLMDIQLNYTIVIRSTTNDFDLISQFINSLTLPSTIQLNIINSSLEQLKNENFNVILSNTKDKDERRKLCDLLSDKTYLILWNDNEIDIEQRRRSSRLNKTISPTSISPIPTESILYRCKDNVCWKLNESLIEVMNYGDILSNLHIYQMINERKIETILLNDLTPSMVIIERIKELVQSKECDRIWLLSTNDDSGVIGMVNCLRKEYSLSEKFNSSSLQSDDNYDKIRCAMYTEEKKLIGEDLTKLFLMDFPINKSNKGVWGSYRYIPFKWLDEINDNYKSDYAYVNTIQRGDLSSLKWIEAPKPSTNKINDLKMDVDLDEKLMNVNVHYSALNFRDIMLASGKLAPDAIPNFLKYGDCLLGMEFSGVTECGERIMGLVPAKALATKLQVPQHTYWTIPDKWSLAEACTIPVAFTTAYYALIVRGRLSKNEKILIHSGSGGVGQCAIAIALSIDAEVFTTCGNGEKKKYLLDRFSKFGLKEDHITNSRDSVEFESHIMKLTNGSGVDVVLNSLAGEKLFASVRLLGMHGRFLEIGKFDLSQNSSLGMSIFLKNITFHGILLDSLFNDQNNLEWKLICQLLNDGINSGVVQPLNFTEFPHDQIENAFRYMAKGKHIGKVLIRIRTDDGRKRKSLNDSSIDQNGVESPINKNEMKKRKYSTTKNMISVISKTWFSSQHLFIITGGLGGFGLEMLQWMTERGGRYFVLTSRSGIKNGYQLRKINKLMNVYNCQIEVEANDLLTEEKLDNFMEKIRRKFPSIKIGGFFHLAMVLDDALFENLDEKKFEKVINVKGRSLEYIDRAFTKNNDLTNELLYFIIFSSISCGRGNAGQSNYGMANSSMERICERRKNMNLPAMAIQWGAIGDVGVVIRSRSEATNSLQVQVENINIGGTATQRLMSCLNTLDYFLCCAREQLRDRSIPVVVSSYVSAKKMKDYYLELNGGNEMNGDESVSIVMNVARILGIDDIDSIPDDRTMNDIGLDSLMSVEIKQMLERITKKTFTNKQLQNMQWIELKNMNAQNDDINNSKDSPVKTSSSTKLLKMNEQIESEFLLPTHRLYPFNEIDMKENEKNNINEVVKGLIIVLHPIEGSIKMITNFCNSLTKELKNNYFIYGINCDQEAIDNMKTVETLAQQYHETIINRWNLLHKSSTTSKLPIKVIGYSFGACIAVELALQFDERYQHHNEIDMDIILIDGSHSFVSVYTEAYRSAAKNEESYTDTMALVAYSNQLLQILLPFKFQNDLRTKCSNLDERINLCIDYWLKEKKFVNNSPVGDMKMESILRKSFHAFFKRLLISEHYKPMNFFNDDRQILLIKSSTMLDGKTSNDLDTSYALSELYKKNKNQIEIHTINDSNHESLMNEKMKIGELINYIVNFIKSN
ncbi:hypothetical protein SNEBB_007999 [Seison nebaliae]|nr:hypothetical protein SNEBB_007999 [Seison nebaliae]